MRRAAQALLITTVVFSLAACSAAPVAAPPAALSDKNVTASLGLLDTANVLLGDAIPLSASVELSGKRTDKVVLRIEQSLDGLTWSTVDEVKDAGPTVELQASATADVAGPLQFRATAVSASKKADALASSEPQTATVADLQQLVRTFYYDLTQAYRTDTQTGITFDEQHNYPGLVDFQSQGWLDRNALFLEAEVSEAMVPDVTTLSPDPTWMMPAGSCNAAQSEPPAGRTFIVSVDTTFYWDGFPATTKADVHVTFLDGVIHHWVACS